MDDDMAAEDIQLRANQVTDESLESTRRMRNLAIECQDTGIKTINMLDEQGEQLNRVEEGLDQINKDMREAEKNLTELNKCCGLCICPGKRPKNFETGDVYKKAWSGKDGSSGEVVSKQPNQANGQNRAGQNGGYVKKITNDAREDEMEENLQEVGGILGQLKNMALDMGNEIDSQNKQIDRINEKMTQGVINTLRLIFYTTTSVGHKKADANKARIDQANTTAKKLIE